MAGLVITPEIEADARLLAERNGVTPTEAVASASRKELQPIFPVTDADFTIKAPRKNLEEIRAILKGIHSVPVDNRLSEDEILGYDEFGVPEQPYLDR